MKVVYVSPHATRGGAERVTMDLLALHRSGGGAVEPVVVFLRDGPLVDEARRLGVQAEVVGVPRMRRLFRSGRAKRALAARLAALKPDLVHGVLGWGHAYAGAAARKARIPAVWFQHDLPDFHRPVNLLAALTPARRILANSDQAGDRRWRDMVSVLPHRDRLSIEAAHLPNPVVNQAKTLPEPTDHESTSPAPRQRLP